MTSYQFYSINDPTVGELVLVEFVEKTESFFHAKLFEYQYTGIMNYSDASKKRKVTSWNSIVPLGKQMVAKVESVDSSVKIVQLSISNLHEYFNEKNLTPQDVQTRHLVKFKENTIMENFCKSICILSNYPFEELWTKLIHYVDTLRRTHNAELNDESDYLSLWGYFSANIEQIEQWGVACEIPTEISNLIKQTYIKRMEDTVKKIVTKVKIISPCGITHTKTLLEECFKSIDFKYTFKYQTAPDYILESSTEDSSQDAHRFFVSILETESQKTNPKVFVQVVPSNIGQIVNC